MAELTQKMEREHKELEARMHPPTPPRPVYKRAGLWLGIGGAVAVGLGVGLGLGFGLNRDTFTTTLPSWHLSALK
jgi:hypothetical protein